MRTNYNKTQQTSSNFEKEIRRLRAELTRKNQQVKKLEEKLEEGKFIFDTILDSTLAGYWDWHIQDNYEYMSPTFKKMFGYEPDEMPNVPESWQKIIHPEDLDSVYEVFDVHVKSKGKIPFDNEVRYFHKDGHIVWVYCRGQVIEWDKKGNPLRMVGCHVDISNLKKMESLTTETERLKVRNTELEQFTYIASHDLQEPLRTVRSFASILEEKYIDKLDKRGLMFLDFIVSGADRMSDLIQALLDHSRIGKDSILKKSNTNHALISLKNDLSVLLNETNTTIESSILPVINIYPIEFKLLLQNLIRNAIKFHKEGESPKIQIDAVQKNNNWLFSITDNGIGIPEDKLEVIFIIFRRLHLRSNYEGTGIGLAHCKKIVDLHQGDIWVESILGEGSTFYFTIPV